MVQDLSSENPASYYACPYCLAEIATEKSFEVEGKKRTQKLKRTKISQPKAQPIEEKPAQQPSPEIPQCSHYFGYLSQRPKKESIPEECMTCEKIVQCMLKKVTG